MYATVIEAGDAHRRLLTRDWLCRKARQWPLSEYVSPRAAEMSKLIYTKFPVLEKILKKYSGKLAVCGGLVSTVFHRNFDHYSHNVLDADIFFYGVSEDEATQILIDCIAIISSEENYTDDQNETNSIRIERRTRITNVSCRNIPKRIHGGYLNPWSTRIYQFIHRIYPSLDSILGGFDLGHAMIAMTDGVDGPKILWTEMGQWSNTENTILIDTSRRSTSYEYRIVKYVSRLRCSICFPGVTIKKSSTRSKPANIMKIFNKLAAEIDSLGLQPKTLISRRAVRVDEESNIDSIQVVLMDNFKVPTRPAKCFNMGRMLIKSPHSPGNIRGDMSCAKLGDELGTIKYLTKHSDYSHSTIADNQIVKANNTALRCKHIDAIMVTFTLDKKMPYEYIVKTFTNMIERPVILYDIRLWEERMREGNYRNLHTNMRVKLFGDRVAELQDLVRKSPNIDIEHSIECNFAELAAEMESQAYIANRQLVGIRWITNNPGRQWTSSINPEVGDPRDYYGHEHYTRFTVGIPSEIETAIRLGIRDPNSPLYILKGKRDVIRLILSHVCLQYC